MLIIQFEINFRIIFALTGVNFRGELNYVTWASKKLSLELSELWKLWSQFGAWSICSTWDLDKSYFMVKILFKLFHRSFVKILIVFWDICRPSNDFFVICQFINDYNHLIWLLTEGQSRVKYIFHRIHTTVERFFPQVHRENVIHQYICMNICICNICFYTNIRL